MTIYQLRIFTTSINVCLAIESAIQIEFSYVKGWSSKLKCRILSDLLSKKEAIKSIWNIFILHKQFHIRFIQNLSSCECCCFSNFNHKLNSIREKNYHIRPIHILIIVSNQFLRFKTATKNAIIIVKHVNWRMLFR